MSTVGGGPAAVRSSRCGGIDMRVSAITANWNAADVLGTFRKEPIVEVEGARTYQPDGELRLVVEPRPHGLHRPDSPGPAAPHNAGATG